MGGLVAGRVVAGGLGGLPRRKPTLRKRKEDILQHFRRAAVSAAFLSSSSQQPFSAALLSSSLIVSKGSCFQNESRSGRSRTCPFVTLGARPAPPNDAAHVALTLVTFA